MSGGFNDAAAISSLTPSALAKASSLIFSDSVFCPSSDAVLISSALYPPYQPQGEYEYHPEPCVAEERIDAGGGLRFTFGFGVEVEVGFVGVGVGDDAGARSAGGGGGDGSLTIAPVVSMVGDDPEGKDSRFAEGAGACSGALHPI